MIPYGNNDLSSTEESSIISKLLDENQILRNTILQMAIDNAKSKPHDVSCILFGDILVDWLENHRKRIEDTTYEGYYYIVYKHLRPYFNDNNVYLHEVTIDVLEDYYINKVNQGLSPNTLVKHHNNIRQALNYAIQKKLILQNPATKEIRPKTQHYQGKYYCVEELEKLLEVAKNHEFFTPIFIAGMLGLRRSEVLGLKWDCINFSERKINIRRKVIRICENKKDVLKLKDKLKSQSSRRELVLPDNLFNHLKHLYKQRKPNKNDFICLDRMGRLISPTNFSKRFGQIVKSNNLRKIRLHDLRHTCASILHKLGYDIKQIQQWLGHSSIEMTSRYIHLFSDEKVSMAKQLNESINFR